MKIAPNLKIPDPMQSKYRSPHTSLNTSPSSRARSSAPSQKSAKRVTLPAKIAQVNQSVTGRGALKEDNSRKSRKEEVSQSFVDLKPKQSDENVDVVKVKDATLKGKDAEISRMDYLIKKYKRDISDQTTQMQELKRTVQSYDLKIEKLVKEKAEERMSASYDQLLKQKDREVQELKEKLESLENVQANRYREKIEQLEAALCGSQAIAKELEDEGLRLKYRVAELESNSDIYTVESIRKERDELRLRNAELSKQLSLASSVSISDFKKLDAKIKELEDCQIRLMTENDILKGELITEQRRNLSETDSYQIIKNACREARFLQREISQLTHLFDTMRRGAEINLSFLLGQSNLKDIDGELSLKDEMTKLSNQMSSLRTLVSDCYAEQCGSH
eukprot:CAMPEP_0204905190 /NCGR_PEP_ID=MMETSP1397-20131031/5290_1 /ASSEMBLY_ACC=CAM_ASM_000891 /TAXON_ID=49980 /ORGANISM="Climacostomum Climacostomum virens, Strain Stock W-24" /LENGTH=390 /DNA_ID=CAMNT_0052074059 /DNA_START=330 /DNA_END=1499 /DNA_ORIENTATION=-